MYNGKIIDSLLKEREITATEFLQQIGWASTKQLYQFRDGNPTAKNLEIVADFFHLPIDALFERDTVLPHDSAHAINQDHLAQLLKAKDELIEEKNKRIATLEKVIALLSERDNNGTVQQ